MIRRLQQELAATHREMLELKKCLEQRTEALASMQDDLERKNVRLEAASKELEVFSYSVSHDLRAPLRHLHGWTTALQEDYEASLDERGRGYVAHITQSVEHMSLLIDALLGFARMAQQPLNQEEIAFDELVREVITDLKPEQAEREIEWTVRPLPVVLGDRSLLRQVWVKLIGNAIKYTRHQAGAHIDIGTMSDEGQDPVFFVKDNGAGFDMKRADRLFGMFQRLHRREEFEGTGLGLAHFRRIVARHEGRTWAHGEAGKGAVFYFSLPKHSS